jgi:hypothetical protein
MDGTGVEYVGLHLGRRGRTIAFANSEESAPLGYLTTSEWLNVKQVGSRESRIVRSLKAEEPGIRYE